ncbi:MAG: DUF5652 family protein [Candidatus Pacearchaeota archaeon]|nr:DUF5652 family protein [Candidatus Pacearchaeota archaeon]
MIYPTTGVPYYMGAGTTINTTLNYPSLFWSLAPAVIFIFVLACVWDSVWKAIGLWKSGRNKQVAWFVCIFIFNTLGILPIIYLLFFQKHRSERRVNRRSSRSRRR